MNICLNMIIRNESPVIKRCLESVKPFIDSWCIVDTGSTDNTKDIVRATMEGIPGTLHERPWVNFEVNRTEAIRLAEQRDPDWLLFIDADEVLQLGDAKLVHPMNRFKFADLSADGYFLPVQYGSTSYTRLALVSTKLKWKWRGVVHEFLESDKPANLQHLTTPTIVVYHEGARARDPKTYEKDALLLEEALRTDPDNARYVFYLAQSWKDAGHPRKAKHFYQERAKMPGWVEETWFAKYEVGRMAEALEYPIEEIQGAYLAAYQFRPTRAEPLYQLARLHRLRNEFALAYMFGRQALSIKRTEDKLFVDYSIYDWRCADEVSIACYYLGRREQGRCLTEELLHNPKLPSEERPRIEENLAWFEK